jgi:chitodextrinase
MKKSLLSLALLALCGFSYAQTWKTTVRKASVEVVGNKTNIGNPRLFELNAQDLQNSLVAAPKRFGKNNSTTVVSFPTATGQMENYRIYEWSNMDPELEAKFPEIKSYIGESITHPGATIHFSLSPLGLRTMRLAPDAPAEFIEPYTTDNSSYVVYRKSDKAPTLNQFECMVLDEAVAISNDELARPNADDGFLRTFRLAVSVTGEYTAYFGGTKALAMAAINNTMTRVNAIFEFDFAARCVLIANNDAVVYTNASTDPYSNASSGAGGAWNNELQSTLTSVIGEANYDVGHLFGASGGGGNAGCIGCVCVNNQKGRGFTSPADGIPQGDNFDIDYVAHELGHQFGANHTFTHSASEGTGAHIEPGSGSTIMGYAGITSKDIQPHSDPYFHAKSIEQVTNNIKNKTCPTKTATGNTIPTVEAGPNYTIPKSTPFMLTGVASDANGDTLTYCWEQYDATTSTANPSATKTVGPNFRSYMPTTSPTRYFPRMQSVLTGATTTNGSELVVEALSSVARTLNFRLTVRDNRAGGGGNNSDDMVVTVNATAGPFQVTSPNTAVSYPGGSTQTITWNVAGTTTNGVNCANVDILLSTDGGNTWTTLLASTPNDGSQAVTIPNTPGTQNRIMVKGTNHIFFDVSNANFTISSGTGDTQAPTAPTNLAASGTTQTSTNLTWTASTDNVAVTGYDVYRNGTLLASTATNSYNATGLTPATTYSFYVRAKDAAGNISGNSNTVNVTMLSGGVTYCASQGNSVADEQIGRVQFAGIDNTSTGGTGYTDFTSVSGTAARGNSYALTITPTWTGTVYPEGYAVFIDWNQDGDFSDSGETVWTQSATNATPVTGNIAIPTTATLGTTRMRVSMKYNGVPTACEAFSYGQVEDYSLLIQAAAADTTPPSAPTNLAASGTTQTSTNLAWTASTDNVGVTGYDVYRNGSLLASTTTNSYNATGLTASTTYSFYVRAKDAAGNVSGNSNTINVTTLANVITYCASQGNSVADERIGRVQFAGIDNTSTGGTGYTDFTNVSGTATRGNSYTITITPTWTGTVYNEGYAVFIDWNGDGDFSDSGETAWTQAATNATSVSGSITIPATASLGTTRMRVSMKYSGVPTACETFSYGQVEDYSLLIQAAAADTIAPSAPTSLTASGTTQTSTNLSWTASTDNVAVTGYDVYRNGSLIASTTTTFYNATGLSAATSYSFYVRAKDAAGNVSGNSNTVNVTTLSNALTYCAAQGNSVADELIARVQFAGIDNSSTGGTGYQNFTNISGNVVRGSSYSISITPQWPGSKYNEGYAVYIDWNQDGDFSDSGETAFTRTATQVTPVTGTITVPANAVLGATRMRVAMRYNAVPAACGSYNYGQVEDYTINISAAGRMEETAQPGITLYPNPVGGNILNVSGINTHTSYRIVNTLGQEVGKGTINDETVDVSNLAAGTYLLEITSGEKSAVKRFIRN